MSDDLLREPGEAEAELERVLSRMKKITRDISRSGHPPSIMQIDELKELGREYARIIERLGDPPSGPSVA